MTPVQVEVGPLDLARRLHDTVAQRLAGLSYFLSAPQQARGDALDLCRTEVDAALEELRDALSTVASANPRDGRAELIAEAILLRERYPSVELDLPLKRILSSHSSPVVVGFLVEALRNVRKHATPKRVRVLVERDADVLTIAVTNDGVRARRGPSCGTGCRLLQVEASLHGGLMDSAPAPAGSWCQRLILPADENLGIDG